MHLPLLLLLLLLASSAIGGRIDDKLHYGVYLLEGRSYLAHGDYERAAEAFNSAIVVNPNKKEPFNGLKAAEKLERELKAIEKEATALGERLVEIARAAGDSKDYLKAVEAGRMVMSLPLKKEARVVVDATAVHTGASGAIISLAQKARDEEKFEDAFKICRGLRDVDYFNEMATECLKKMTVVLEEKGIRLPAEESNKAK